MNEKEIIVIDKRLLCAVELLPYLDCIADIGCDHGKVAAYLLQTNKTKKVIATDISQPSLQKAKELAEKLNLSHRLITRVGDGFSPIENDEADGAIICGMGGETISEILKNKKIDINLFVFQPMSKANVLRKYLRKNNYQIIDEKVVVENKKYYEIMLVSAKKAEIEKPKGLPWNALDEIGPILYKKRDKLAFERIIKQKNRLIDQLKNAKSPESEQELIQRIDLLGSIEREY